MDPVLAEGGTLEEALAKALGGGARFFQYRDKGASRRERYRRACALRAQIPVSGPERGIFLVNDDLDIALAAGADGVHLGREDFPVDEARRLAGAEFLIGASAHTVEEARGAQTRGASYLGIGPIFRTATKKDAQPPVGPAMVRAVRQAIGIPLYAIGGVTIDSLPELFGAGASGVAVISAIAGDIEENCRRWVKKIESILSLSSHLKI